MRSFLLSLSLTFFSLNLVAQVDSCKWLVDNAAWCYSEWSWDTNNDIAQVRIFGDTLIDNRLCSIMGLTIEDVFVEGSRLIIFYDEINELVYFFEDEEFRLLYNFSSSLLVGDTVEFYLPQNFNLYDISSGADYSEELNSPYSHIVTNQKWDSLANGELIRILETRPIPEEYYECYYMPNIVDGVGSLGGFLGIPCISITAGFGPYFRGFESSSLTYIKREGCTVTSVNSVGQALIDVFPNPTSGIIRITSEEDQIKSIQIFSISGAKVYEQIVDNHEIEISVHDLTSGLYWLDVALHNGKSYIDRISVLK